MLDKVVSTGVTKMKIVIDEGERKVKLYITRSDLDSVALTAIFDWYKIKPKMEDIDEELHPLIRSMWENGYRTFNCCSGHNKVPGFIAFLPPGKRQLRAASWGPDEPIPQNITELNGILKSSIILAKDDDFQPFVDKIKQYQEVLNEK